ncbi:hypothetical protein LTR36_003434 [Oleoguttula mirabilis]|uniref:F-box domain-containing protein n=1 Tax=Oleoguttula mirabilis TaxID=1507867 RepID=A0AAV9JJS6_9PEZI|nr:hypothetical protein LTR36_003434 [Oleoguttula mirabilis]
MAADTTKDDLAKLLTAVTVNQTNLFTKLTDAAKLNVQLFTAIKGSGVKLKLESSTSRVFQTVELAEAIFRQCEFGVLLRLQAICRHWQHVIGTSIILRHKMHLAPAHTDAIRYLSRYPVHIHNAMYLHYGCTLICIDLRGQVAEQHSALTDRYIEPSWEAMTPTQPPAHKMSYRIACYNTSGSGERVIDAADSKGITFNQMQCAAQASFDEHMRTGSCNMDCGQAKRAFFTVLHYQQCEY